MITNIQQWAENRNTDLRVALQIVSIANGDEDEAERIWDEPTEDDVWNVFESMIGRRFFNEYDIAWGDTTIGDILDGFLEITTTFFGGQKESDTKGNNSTHYPGTRQLCCLCDEPAGRCEEDSIYIDECTVPVCEDCYISSIE